MCESSYALHKVLNPRYAFLRICPNGLGCASGLECIGLWCQFGKWNGRKGSFDSGIRKDTNMEEIVQKVEIKLQLRLLQEGTKLQISLTLTTWAAAISYPPEGLVSFTLWFSSLRFVWVRGTWGSHVGLLGFLIWFFVLFSIRTKSPDSFFWCSSLMATAWWDMQSSLRRLSNFRKLHLWTR